MVSHVTFLTATKLHADLALAIETRLRNEQVSSTFLTCDNHYHQRAGETLVAAQKTPVALSTRAEVTDWPAMSRAERVPHLESARENLFRLFSSLKTDVVVVFFDRGDLEQLTLRAAERFGIRTVCIQDGLLGLSRAQWENSESPTPKIYPASPGEGGADQFLIWGENFKRDLESVGICSQVEVVGSLRHDRLAQIANFRVKGPPYVIVLSGQPFSTFGFMFTSQEIALYERVARQLLARPDTKVIFRPHPESDLKDFYYKLPATFGDRLSVDIDSDLFDLLSQADGLVTVSSTVAVESAALGIPTARLPHLIGVVQRDTFLLENGKFEAKINAKDFPASLTFGIDGEDLQSYGGKYLGTLDGRSLERTCSSILGQSKSKDPVGYQASVTALIESVGDDPTATIHSLLRQRISELNVVVYDRSPNQSLVQRLPKLFSDPRVTVKPAPGQRSGPALNAGLEGSTSEYILRIYPGTVLLPNALPRLLKKTDEFSLCSSWYLGRNADGCFEGIVVTPPTLTVDLFRVYTSYQFLAQCYTVRRELLSSLLGFPDGDNPDAAIFESFLSKGKPLVVENSPLFLNVPAYRSEADHLFETNWDRYYQWIESAQYPSEPREASEYKQAVSLMKEKKDEQALSLLEQIVSHEGTNVEALYALALCQARLARVAEAKDSLKKLLEISPHHKDANELLPLLQSS